MRREKFRVEIIDAGEICRQTRLFLCKENEIMVWSDGFLVVTKKGEYMMKSCKYRNIEALSRLLIK